MDELRIPDNLDLDALMEQCPVEFSAFKRDKVYFVCDAIYRNSLKLNDKTFIHPSKDEPYFVPLQATILSHYLGNNYLDILQWMQAVGIIEADGTYQPQVVSTGYRFTTTYRHSDYKTIEITDFIMARKKPKHDNTRHSKTVNTLRSWFKGLSIDLVQANRIVDGIYENDLQQANGNSTLIEAAKQRWLNYRLTIDLFKEGTHTWYVQDNYGYRLHTIITSLPKFLRGLVLYNGQPLAQTDLCNSQLFSTFFLFFKNNWNKSTNKYTNQIWNGISVTNPNQSTTIPIYSSIIFTESSKTFYSGEFQKDKFAKMAVEGKIYDHFVPLMERIEGYFAPEMTDADKRNQIKHDLLTLINSDNSTGGFNFKFIEPIKPHRAVSAKKENTHKWIYKSKKALWDVFKEEFPLVAQIYEYIKQNDYRNLGRVLQRIETIAVIEHSCKYITEKYPEIPIFSLHDCLVTTEEHIETVNEIFRDAVGDFIGAKPKTEIKKWSAYNELINPNHRMAA